MEDAPGADHDGPKCHKMCTHNNDGGNGRERHTQRKTEKDRKDKQTNKKGMTERARGSTLIALWRRLAVLTRDPSAATPDEGEWLGVLARDAGIEGSGRGLTDEIVGATLSAHMPLWEAMVDAQSALPWVGDRAGPFPHPLGVFDNLRARGCKAPMCVRDVDFETRLFTIVRMIDDAVAREPPAWPSDFESQGNAAGRPPKMCALVVGTVSPGTHRTLVAVPFVSPWNGQSDVGVYRMTWSPPDTVKVFCGDRDLLVRALVHGNRDEPLRLDEAHVDRALTTGRLCSLGALAVEAVGRGAREALGLRPTHADLFVKRLLGLAHLIVISSTILWLGPCAHMHVAFMGAADLVDILDTIHYVDGVRGALARPTLRNAAAAAVARDPDLSLCDRALKTLDRESVALVAAHLFQYHAQRIVNDNDLLQRVADALGVSDTRAPLGSDRHCTYLCRAVALAVARHYGLGS